MTAMIDITNAEKTFTMHLQGGVELPVVRGVSFHVVSGECVVLSGPSGAGKSSILKMIFGNYRCDGGRIGIRHQGAVIDLATAEPRQVLSVRRSTIGYVSQFLRAVPRVATIDVVAEPLIANGTARAMFGAQRFATLRSPDADLLHSRVQTLGAVPTTWTHRKR
jgi:alpha-D-ribose 1-methylphosphonate 5-triphosphate synthase subunit PhnL